MFKITAFVVVLFFFLLGPPARAFDLSPEFQGLSESDLLGFEQPQAIDSEYQTVWNAYLPPLEFAKDWRTHKQIFQFSIGSLSNKYFFLASRAGLETDLTPTLRFRFTYMTQRDFEIDQTRHVLELIQRLAPQWELSLFGEPSLYKRENDLGAALIYSPQTHLSHRLFYTRHDFTRAEHSNLPDRFERTHNPNSIGWIGTWHTTDMWMEAGLRSDTPTIWLRPQEDRIFTFEKKLAYLDFKKELSTKSALLFRAQWDRQKKGQSPLTATSTVPAEEWRLERTFAQASWRLGEQGEFLRHEPALTWVTREWRNLTGSEVHHQNIQPSYTAIWRGPRRDLGFDVLRTGVELTSFHKSDPDRLTSIEQANAPFEGRLHASYEWTLLHSAKLRIGANFDLDQWRTIPTFEGGSGEFQATW